MFLKSIIFNKKYVVYPWFSSPNRVGEKEKTVVEYVGYYDRRYSELARAKTKKLRAEGKLKVWENARLTKEESRIETKVPHVDLYPAKLKIEFKEGINLIVGDNGSGKTTLAHIIAKFVSGDDKKLREEGVEIDMVNLTVNNLCGWDFEKDNPTVNEKMRPNPDDSKNFMSQTLSLMSTNQESHGETNKGILDAFEGVKGYLIIFDEPDSGLSLFAQYKYWNKLKTLAENNQVILISHSKVFIEEAEEVFDLSSKKWTNSKKYLNKIKKQYGK